MLPLRIALHETMLKISLIISGFLSFWFFLSPTNFSGFSDSAEKVLGVQSMNQAANERTVYTAVLVFCLDNERLPMDLNQLYEDELSDKMQIDLNSLFKLEEGSETCEFRLKSL